MSEDKKALSENVFVLDTNVLMHDPTSIFRFQEHDIFLPMIVLEELDSNKRGFSEVNRNVRQVSRFIEELIRDVDLDKIDQGLQISSLEYNGISKEAHGRLYFYTKPVPNQLSKKKPDNEILSVALTLQEKHPESRVSLVSKDINLRIKAAVVGIKAEDYHNDKVIEDVDLLYTGHLQLPETFWEDHPKDLDSWQESGQTFYSVRGEDVKDWHPGLCLGIGDEMEAVVRRKESTDIAIIERLSDHRTENHAVWGIMARNTEQNFALNLLLDPEIDFVSLIGQAGTGKTLLALAAGLHQTLDKNIYSEIIMTRITVPVGEDIGFLPGTEEEKMAPWMGALMDNLEVLTRTEGGEWGRGATDDLLKSRIRIRSLNFMRGRTFLKRYIILDEAQNLTTKQMQTLISRAGPGTKIVCLGNVAQIDTPYLTETTSGLTNVVEKFKVWPHSGHITLLKGERSRLADFANEAL